MRARPARRESRSCGRQARGGSPRVPRRARRRRLARAPSSWRSLGTRTALRLRPRGTGRCPRCRRACRAAAAPAAGRSARGRARCGRAAARALPRHRRLLAARPRAPSPRGSAARAARRAVRALAAWRRLPCSKRASDALVGARYLFIFRALCAKLPAEPGENEGAEALALVAEARELRGVRVVRGQQRQPARCSQRRQQRLEQLAQRRGCGPAHGGTDSGAQCGIAKGGRSRARRAAHLQRQARVAVEEGGVAQALAAQTQLRGHGRRGRAVHEGGHAHARALGHAERVHRERARVA
nr:MAG: hypothetical protein [Molluscum contagiosum virus]